MKWYETEQSSIKHSVQQHFMKPIGNMSDVLFEIATPKLFDALFGFRFSIFYMIL